MLRGTSSNEFTTFDPLIGGQGATKKRTGALRQILEATLDII
jgi:hypothetical protein